MRRLAAGLILLAATPCLAAAAIPCSDVPKAQSFINSLRPGPNTRAAQQHLDAARHAHSARQCSAELAKVDHYARLSAAADHRASKQGR